MVYVSFFSLFVIGFLTAQILKRNDLADVLWGLSFGILALGFMLNTLAMWLILAWSLRLSFHIGTRFKKHIKEDERYAAFRKKWGNWQTTGAFLQVFVLQSLLALIVALPIIYYQQALNAWYNYLGLALWIFGFSFEVIADWQLKKFLCKKTGKACNIGLWKYSRHPNYFGEVVLWWGFYLLTLNPATPWFVVLGPIMINILILKVSGVSMLEKRMQNNPKYTEYLKTTSRFFPWFQKKL